MKFCICFFGVIGRSLEYTIESINKNILNILKSKGINYDIYIHNNKIDKIVDYAHKCEKEKNCKIDNTIYKKLNPTHYIETNQEDFDKEYDWLSIFKNGDPHNDNFKSIKNAIREIYSIKQVTTLWKDKPKYDFYLYLRPDLKYINLLDIDLIINNLHIKNTLFTPDWHGPEWCLDGINYGLNDRIYGGDYDTILKIGNRIDNIQELICNTKHFYHAETYMRQIVNKFKIELIFIKLRGYRIRANGYNSR